MRTEIEIRKAIHRVCRGAKVASEHNEIHEATGLGAIAEALLWVLGDSDGAFEQLLSGLYALDKRDAERN